MLKKFARFEEILLVLSLGLMVALIFGQVIGRYVFSSAPSWTEEMARYIHIFQVWIGASYAVKLRQHIRVEAFITRFHGVFRQVLEILSIVIWFVMALFLAVFGTELVLSSINHGQLAPAMQIPIWIPYLAIPLGGIGMAIRLVIQVKEVIRGNYEKPKEEEIML
ncbi:TRAP transporter small permease [Psychrobacillus sp. FSL W7-1457]|uniref:TRAP transporter small permease n=1 Tax=unclassified Psychrobacillus TaxID=2636677 RepID=UPI00203CF5DB|nr:TRAP transporter small permease [Psychrobacillus sp. MER TA 171]MCM3356707.1 TRAP transporter small permease [Psychrobacillus sp. MER TA 171]